MLLEKQKEIIQWCAENNVVVSPDLMNLWNQAIASKEDQGKETYQEFLNKWKEFQKKSADTPGHPEPTEWQKQLLLKQQEIIEIAKINSFTIPREITDLWEVAINAGEDKGNDTYKEFLEKWTKYENEQLKREDEYTDDPNDDRTYSWPVINDEMQNYNVPYDQWNVDPNWNPGVYSQNYPYQNYYPLYQYPSYPSQYYPYSQNYYQPYQGQYPNQNQPPYQGYQNLYQYQMSYQGRNPYTMPYQQQLGYNMEPFAGQKLGEWQNKLQKVREEILQWSEDNRVQISGDLIMSWEDAMIKGTQDSYDKFMQIWEQFRSEAPIYLNTDNKDVVGTMNNTEDRIWEYAVMNEIQGQNNIGFMLGLNLINELNYLQERIFNADPITLNSIIDSIMDTWDRINLEVQRNAQREQSFI